MLSDASHELQFGDAKGLASCLSTDLLGDIEFYFERLSAVLMGVLAPLS